MSDDERADYLAEVAQEMVTRVRDEDPQANFRWLESKLPDPIDWWHLCFVLAAAIPDDRSWLRLTAWARVSPGVAVNEDGLIACGTWQAAKRHRYHKEPVCPPCLEAERQRNAGEWVRRRSLRDAATSEDAA